VPRLAKDRDGPTDNIPENQDNQPIINEDKGVEREKQAEPRSGSLLNNVIRSAMLKDLSYLKVLGVDTVLETEIIVRLLDGRKTAGELVESIFSRGNDDPDFHQYYMRVCRCLKGLESKGYVSRQLFGSRKPFRLTRHAIDLLLKQDPGSEKGLVRFPDLALYIVTFLAAVCTIIAESGATSLPRSQFMVLYTVFAVLAGMSILKFLETVRKAW
jgi:hypothetical protein